MANDQVEEIKQKIDMVQLVSEYVPLKKAGRNFKGNCPFHGEKTPSFMVNQELQIFKCFGCQEGGDAITFLQKIEGLEFGEALQNLAKRVGVVLTTYKPTGVELAKEKTYKLLEQATEAYHFMLTKHAVGKVALDYALGRGITREAIEKFRLGYVPEGWDFVTSYLTKKKGYVERDVEMAGLGIVGNRGVYDRFRNRLMFPLANNRGQVVGFAGRVLPEEIRNPKSEIRNNELQNAKYINTPETEVYHKGDLLYAFDINRSEIKLQKTAVVVEGEIDAIASWQAGVKNVVAIKGSALTERQVELLARVCETLVMALDADMAGDAASRRGITLAENKGLLVKVTNPQSQIPNYKYKDPGDVATAEPEMWKQIVASAIPVYDFYLESAVKRYGLEATGKQKIGKELLPIWQTIPDEIVKAHYIQKLATVLGVREEDVRGQLMKHQIPSIKSQINPNIQNTNDQKNDSERERKEGRVVMLAILGKKTKELGEERTLNLFKDSFWIKVIKELEEKELGELPVEVKTRVTDLLLNEEEYSDKSWNEAKKLLELLNIEEELNVSGDLDVIKRLSTRKAELKKEL